MKNRPTPKEIRDLWDKYIIEEKLTEVMAFARACNELGITQDQGVSILMFETADEAASGIKEKKRETSGTSENSGGR